MFGHLNNYFFPVCYQRTIAQPETPVLLSLRLMWQPSFSRNSLSPHHWARLVQTCRKTWGSRGALGFGNGGTRFVKCDCVTCSICPSSNVRHKEEKTVVCTSNSEKHPSGVNWRMMLSDLLRYFPLAPNFMWEISPEQSCWAYPVGINCSALLGWAWR